MDSWTFDLKYPGIYLILAFVLIIYICRLYYKNSPLKKELRYFLISVRVVIIILITLFLFEPVLIRNIEIKK